MSLADETILEHLIVRHKVTHEKFIMKTIAHDEPQCFASQARAELHALQKCSRRSSMALLVDYFTDEQGNAYIVQEMHRSTFRAFLDKKQSPKVSNCCDE